MISKCLSTSRKFSELHSDSARMLFSLLVVHSDDFGRLDGSAFYVKHNCIPTLTHLNEDKVEDILQDMARVGLIKRASIQDVLVIQICQFDEHQGGLHKRTKSKFPEVPGDSENFRLNRTEGNRIEVELKGTEKKINTTAPKKPDADSDNFYTKVKNHYSDKLKEYDTVINIDWPTATKILTRMKKTYSAEQCCEIIDLAFRGQQARNGFWELRPTYDIRSVFGMKVLDFYAKEKAFEKRTESNED